MKNKKLKSKYITILRYIFRGTLASSIYYALRSVCMFDVTNQGFGVTLLKLGFCLIAMSVSAWGLITIDEHLSRRIDKMDAKAVADSVCSKPCDSCAYDCYDCERICEKGDCMKGVSEWLNERC